MSIASVAIVGGGALGCYFAARIAESGPAVTVIDVDEQRLLAIAAEGIIVTDARGRRAVPVQACAAHACEGPVDLVMLFTKGMHSAAAARSIAHLAQPATLAVTLQNGLGNAEILAGIFEPGNVLIGMTDVPADLQAPNRVASIGDSESALGSFRPEGAHAVEAVAGMLRKAGLKVDTASDVRARIWEKLAFNAALNAVSTVTRMPNAGMNSEPGRHLLAAVAQEAIAVAQALGIPVDGTRAQEKIVWALAEHADHRPSMLQDFAAGRPTEIESINGAVVRAGESVGIPTPLNATLAALIRMMEAGQAPSPS